MSFSHPEDEKSAQKKGLEELAARIDESKKKCESFRLRKDQAPKVMQKYLTIVDRQSQWLLALEKDIKKFTDTSASDSQFKYLKADIEDCIYMLDQAIDAYNKLPPSNASKVALPVPYDQTTIIGQKTPNSRYKENMKSKEEATRSFTQTVDRLVQEGTRLITSGVAYDATDPQTYTHDQPQNDTEKKIKKYLVDKYEALPSMEMGPRGHLASNALHAIFLTYIALDHLDGYNIYDLYKRAKEHSVKHALASMAHYIPEVGINGPHGIYPQILAVYIKAKLEAKQDPDQAKFSMLFKDDKTIAGDTNMNALLNLLPKDARDEFKRHILDCTQLKTQCRALQPEALQPDTPQHRGPGM